MTELKSSKIQLIRHRHADDLVMLASYPERCTDDGWQDVADIRDMLAEIERLRAALRDAREAVAAWRDYEGTPQYQKQLDEIDALLGVPAVETTPQQKVTK